MLQPGEYIEISFPRFETFEDWKLLLRKLILGWEFLEELTPNYIDLLRQRIDGLCDFMHSLPRNSSQRIELKSLIRTLAAELDGKTGNAQIIQVALPNINEAEGQDLRKRPRNHRFDPPTGW